MQKEKRYVKTRFSADVLDKAVKVFKDIAEKSGNEIHVERYKVEHDDAEWQHGVLDEFLADYRRYGKDAQVTVSGSGVSLFVLVISRNTSVAVEAIERGDVEKIFGIFEGSLKESHLDEVESSEGKDPKEVTETRSVRISDKIITLRNIQSLGDVLLESCRKEGGELGCWDVTFKVDCENATFESGSLDIFDAEKSIITKKIVRGIALEASNFRARSRIDIILTHGDDSYRNLISIRGTESNWVNGTLKSLEETVAGFKPQSNIIKKNKIKLGVLAAFSIGSIILYLISFIADPSTSSGSEPGKLAEKILLLPFGVFFIKYLIAFLLGLMPAFFLMDKLQALWPSVELKVGPDHLRIENSRRLWLANLFVLGVFPLLISALYDFLKSLGKSFH